MQFPWSHSSYIMIFFYKTLKKDINRGFTLIELLVVVAIIGLLSSIVLASLNSARVKGSNAALVSQLTNMRTEAELLLNSTDNYDALCNSGTISGSHFQNAAKNGNQGLGRLGLCLSSGTTCSFFENGVVTLNMVGCKVATPGQWAVSVGLKDGSGYYCVDYRGTGRVQAGRGIDNSGVDMDC